MISLIFSDSRSLSLASSEEDVLNQSSTTGKMLMVYLQYTYGVLYQKTLVWSQRLLLKFRVSWRNTENFLQLWEKHREFSPALGEKQRIFSSIGVIYYKQKEFCMKNSLAWTLQIAGEIEEKVFHTNSLYILYKLSFQM